MGCSSSSSTQPVAPAPSGPTLVGSAGPLEAFAMAHADEVLFPELACKEDMDALYKVDKVAIERQDNWELRSAQLLATGEQRQAKFFPRALVGEAEAVALAKEVRYSQQARQAYLLRSYEFFERPEGFYLMQEKPEGGDLFDRLAERGHVAESDAREIVRALVNALDHMHSRGIVHRNLKTESVYLTDVDGDSGVKLGGFSFATRLPQSPADKPMTTQCGTPAFVAPEVLSGKPYTEAVDVWSLGVLTYNLLCGQLPFSGASDAELFARIRSAEFRFPPKLWAPITNEAMDFIRELLVVNPDYRLALKAVQELPWLTITDPYAFTSDGEQQVYQKEYGAVLMRVVEPFPLERVVRLTSMTTDELRVEVTASGEAFEVVDGNKDEAKLVLLAAEAEGREALRLSREDMSHDWAYELKLVVLDD